MKIKGMVKNLISHKINGDGSVFTALVGFMLLFTVTCIFVMWQTNDLRVKEHTYIEDGLASSLLGASLISTEEYGLSNEVVAFDPLVAHEHDLYYSVKPIKLAGSAGYHSTYAVEKGKNFYSLMGSTNLEINNFLSNTVAVTGVGPKQNFNTFKDLLKINLSLDDNMVPSDDNVYMSKVKENGSPNVVEISTFKIYNYYEYVVMADNYNTLASKPLMSTAGVAVSTCDETIITIPGSSTIWGNGLFSWSELRDKGLVHCVIVEYTLNSNGDIVSVTRHNPNTSIKVTDSSGNEIKNEKNETMEVNATTFVAELSFDINLGKDTLGGNDNFKSVKINKVSVVESTNK